MTVVGQEEQVRVRVREWEWGLQTGQTTLGRTLAQEVEGEEVAGQWVGRIGGGRGGSAWPGPTIGPPCHGSDPDLVQRQGWRHRSAPCPSPETLTGRAHLRGTTQRSEQSLAHLLPLPPERGEEGEGIEYNGVIER